MADELDIRESISGDLNAIQALYPAAFPDEDLLPLVRELLQENSITLSLVGVMERSVVGHVVFTRCGIADQSDDAALLGPLAVVPDRHRQGIGSAMVKAGLQKLPTIGVNQVYVLGDPAYYGRLGFRPEVGVTPPYPLPAEWQGAWQSINLAPSGPERQGKLSVPQVWCQSALWAP